VATVFEIHDRDGRLVNMTLDSVRSEGPLSPRLTFKFECRPLHPFTQVHLTQLQSDVRFELQLLGALSMRELMEIVPSGGQQIALEASINREALGYVDEHARSRWVELMFEFRGHLKATKQAPGPNGYVDSVESVEWSDHYVRSGQNTVRISKDEWIGSVVEPLGSQSHVLLDLPVPPPPDQARWLTSLDHLREAERFYRDGNDPEVLHRCYAAFDAMAGAPRNIFEGLRAADPDKGDKVDKALLAFRSFLQAGRHVSPSGVSEGEFPVDRRDSEFALLQTKAWLTYVARLLANTL
jgi:hypothetical protein